MEDQFSVGQSGKKLRPFSLNALIQCRGYSGPCQRVLCDFGADHPFGQVSKKMQEHYGIEVPTSAVRRITEQHAHTIWMNQMQEDKVMTDQGKALIIGESDGCLIPIVETGIPQAEQREDRRKNKQLKYREARLSLAHEWGCRDIYYAGTFQSVEVAGQQLARCVKRVGCDATTQVHCVGDGARWIAEQVEKHFGSNGTYLIDFYHLCEYLAAAAVRCAPGETSTWMEAQKTRLKTGEINHVLRQLKPYLEEKTIPDEQAPVRVCYRYIENRLDQLDYKSAIEKQLPIGSGEVESAHRYIAQQRLKIAGAWWKLEHAESMLALRVCRANQDWDAYWQQKQKAA